ncbi:LamG domain-containing protein [bacterium]|nr:LamG domain-containing protein [bacterium]
MKILVASLTLVCISLVVISLVFTGQSYARIDPETIVGMWLLDEGSGNVAKDTSGNGHDGEIKGAKWIDGKFKKALEFDGSAHVNAGEVPLPENKVTVVLWVSIDTSQQWIHIIENGVVENTWHGGFRLEVGGEGVTYIAIGDGSAYKDNAGNGIPTGWKYKEWYHLGFTYDGKVARHYHNGDETHTFDSNLDITKGVGTLIFGSMQGTQRFLEGRIDDVAIFNVVLGKDDMKTIMNKGLFGVSAAVSSSRKLTTTWSSIKKH